MYHFLMHQSNGPFRFFTIMKAGTSLLEIGFFVHFSTLKINVNAMYVCRLCLNAYLVAECVSL